MLDYLFTFCAFGVLILCFSGILRVVFGNLFRIDKW
jgi:hypothetical protein